MLERECITDSWRCELLSFAMVITQSNGKSIMWYVAHVPPSSNTFSLSLALSLRFWHWTSPHIHSAVCACMYFFKGEHWFSFSFHQIFILSPWLSLFCGHSHYSFWRCVVLLDGGFMPCGFSVLIETRDIFMLLTNLFIIEFLWIDFLLLRRVLTL